MPTKRLSPLPTALLWLVVTAILAVATFFRVWYLGNIPGLNGDEAEYGAKALDFIHNKPVTWMTANGSHQNFLYFLPILALHYFFPPSVVLLRTVAVVCGIGALVSNFFLCRRVFGTTMAVVTTLILAVLPESIAQSRIGWDPCQSLLIDSFTIYLSLWMVKEPAFAKRNLMGAIASGFVGMTIHAPNMFTFAFPIVCACLVWRESLATFWLSRRGKISIVSTTVLIVVATGLAITLLPQLFKSLAGVRGVHSPIWVLEYERLFSGASTYAYFAGPPLRQFNVSLTDVLATLPWLFTLGWAIATFRNWRTANHIDLAIAAGWLSQLIGFVVVFTGSAMLAGNERYALCLIIPGILAFSRAVIATLERQPVAIRATVAVAGLGVLSLGLLQFNTAYFDAIRRTGGTSESAYKTGPIDPKLEAWGLIKLQLVHDHMSYICADSWWTYQPLRYFASTTPNVIVLKQIPKDPEARDAFKAVLGSGDVWFVEFRSYDPTCYRLSLPSVGIPCSVTTAYGYNHVPLVDVIHALATSGGN